MGTWIMEPGHTEAEFKARHMMVTWVRGLFKGIHGTVDFEWDQPLDASFKGVIDARKSWTGEPPETPISEALTSSSRALPDDHLPGRVR